MTPTAWPHAAADWLEQRARVTGDAAALYWRERRWTYGELNVAVDRFVEQLQAAGVRSDTRVALLMANRVEAVVLVHALGRLGAVLIALNTRLTAAELARQLAFLNCKHLIFDKTATVQVNSLNQRDDLVGMRWFCVDPGLSPTDVVLDLNQDSAVGAATLPLDPSRTQAILFTSGTTGQAKAVPITYAAHLASATASAFRLALQERDSWLACMPIYHIGGLAILFRACLYGISIILQPGFEAQAVDDALRKYNVTFISLVPTMLHRLLTLWETGSRPSSLRTVLLGGAAADPALLDRALGLGVPLALTYGLTETTSQAATMIPSAVRAKPGSAGRPLMFFDINILDNKNRSLPAHSVGQIAVAGPGLMSGYINQPEASAAVVVERSEDNGSKRWLLTGDIGYQDGDGDLWVLARRTDLIVSGGENVYPIQVETILCQHPAIVEACVIRLADPEWGQQVAAVLVLEADVSAAEIQAFCRPRMAGYKCPRLFKQTGDLPRTASGKLKRAEAAATWAKLKDLTDEASHE